MAVRTIEVPLNRVEGDLEVRVTVEDNRVVDAWSAGTTFRGFERLLVGRAPLDGLVLTPRICGMCSTAHLYVAARALENLAGIVPPPDAIRVRNVALLAENLQNDIRHSFLLFGADFVNEAYADLPIHAEAVRRYAPLAGTAAASALRESRKLLEIIAILGGQWPHSSFMVPGGVASVISAIDFLQCRHVLSRFRTYYETDVLGCPIARIAQVKTAADLDAWLDESPKHRDSELGFFLRFSRVARFAEIGKGPGNYVSYGSFDIPKGSAVQASDGGPNLIPSGFLSDQGHTTFDERQITEHIAHSWLVGYEGGMHPSTGVTEPYATGAEGTRYSWAKAPRYAGGATEVGPLAELLIAGHPLLTDLVAVHGGSNVLVRQLARLLRGSTVLPAMATWLEEVGADPGGLVLRDVEMRDGEGVGLGEAARGGLGHWIRVEAGRISRYQVITPTGWNGSPRDAADVRGPWEDALRGIAVPDLENPIAIGHVVRSFDPCLVCTVHAIDVGNSKPAARFRI